MATLIREVPGRPSENARYLLHIYDGPPSQYISTRLNKNKNGAGGKRHWVSVIYAPGVHNFTIADLEKEPPTFQAKLGDMGQLSVRMTVTNVAVSPVEVVDPSPRIADLPLY